MIDDDSISCEMPRFEELRDAWRLLATLHGLDHGRLRQRLLQNEQHLGWLHQQLQLEDCTWNDVRMGSESCKRTCSQHTQLVPTNIGERYSTYGSMCSMYWILFL